MSVLVSTIAWLLYALLEGVREARHFYYRVNSRKDDNYNEHADWVYQRAVVWTAFLYLSHTNVLTTLANGIALALMFVLLHDGMYYLKRNKLDNTYPLGFWAQSTTSTSWFDKMGFTKPVFRVVYFVIGALMLLIFNHIIK